MARTPWWDAPKHLAWRKQREQEMRIRHELTAHGVPTRAAHAIARAYRDNPAAIFTAPDAELIQVRNLGRLGLQAFRAAAPTPVWLTENESLALNC